MFLTVIVRHLLLIGVVAVLGEDLLDEYVRHIDKVNRIKEKPNNFDQRWRRKRDVPNQWTHSEVLDNAGEVVLRWQPRHEEILFRVEARTKGYIAIGFSSDGKKENADIVMGWVDDRSLKAFLLVRNKNFNTKLRILITFMSDNVKTRTNKTVSFENLNFFLLK